MRSLTVVAVVGAALALSGCDQVRKVFGSGEPSGQVVATVDGQEITSIELRTELGGFGSRDPKVMKAAQQQALQRIIMRKLLAQQAREQKLDKSSEFAVQLERGEETLLAQLYQRKLATSVKQPTKAEAEAYVSSHPDQFSGRRILFINQVIAAPNKIAPERLTPLKSLGDVKALLDLEGVAYQDNAVVLDTLSANPQLVAGISRLPPGEVFVVQQGGALVFNHVEQVQPAPFRGDVAISYAMNQIRSQRAQETVGKKITDMRKAAESKITYNPAFKPEPPSKKAPATKAAPAAAAQAPAAAPAAPAAK